MKKLFLIPIIAICSYFLFWSDSDNEVPSENNYYFEIYGDGKLLWTDVLGVEENSVQTNLLDKLDCSHVKCDYDKKSPYFLIFSRGNENNKCDGFYVAEQFEKLVPWRKNDKSLLLPSIKNSGICVQSTNGEKIFLGQIKGSHFGLNYSIIIKKTPFNIAF